jgi:D-glycero-alpha-D-manno-heptose-7-phosphate kinase
MSDVPAGTGLGSSSAFTVAMLAFARAARGLQSTPYDLANEAAEIEIDVLKEPIGRQDQWASAFGGFNRLVFEGTRVGVERIPISSEVKKRIEASCYLISAGAPRRTAEVLGRISIDAVSKVERNRMTGQLAALVGRGLDAIQGNLDDLGPLLDEAWSVKKQVFNGVSNPEIDELYRFGIQSGATGGKLLGAGTSGYLLFYVPQKSWRTFKDAFPKYQAISICESGGGIIHES